ncbi:DUF1801 domain-containing protein [Aestuariivivens marinum]|uniref:DUF1801 domain-containing protein n=1 Tax=Aestuariivivens marinum TaxID=2913555 RepID=UPI001F591567|nr:DUF1801 domain-containing protein [Aestuariivivens marinum]
MQYKATSPDDYINLVPKDHRDALIKLRKTIAANLPEGFEEGINYNMIGYYIPHSVYPNGYHCDPKLPLPFMNIASQKNSINVYHMGIYANESLKKWFVDTYKKQSTKKLDMGKSCIRFKKGEDIPFGLIGELAGKISANEWITYYETVIKK